MKLIKICEVTLALVGLAALGYWVGKHLSARYYQIVKGREFSQDVGARLFVQSTPRKPEEGEVIGRIRIPRLGLSSIVVEGAQERELGLAPGHISGTSLPGEHGNVAIAGHRDTFFRPLRFIRRDDTIRITTLSGEYDYRVVSTAIVGPDQVQVLYPTKADSLTLVTCYPFSFVGPAPQRFIVKAERL